MKSPTGSPQTLLESVLNQLGTEIVSGVLQPGDTFTLREMGTRFGISRTVAREAMRALEQLGLVSSARRVGITVSPRRRWHAMAPSVIVWRLAVEAERACQLRSLLELRQGIEPVAARLAALRASDAQRAQLVELANQLAQLQDVEPENPGRYLDVDIAFHRLIIEASGNELFQELGPGLAYVLRGRSDSGLEHRRPTPESIHAHEALAHAIYSGQAEEAELQARAILREVHHSLPGLYGTYPEAL